MIYDFLKDLSKRVEDSGFSCVILTEEPSVYDLNTAYITFPNNFPTNYCISSDAMSDFEVSIDFITHQCEATRIEYLHKNIEDSLKRIIPFLRDNIDRIKGDYVDEDMETCCYRNAITPHQWLTGGKILISTRLTLYYKAILTVPNNVTT